MENVFVPIDARTDPRYLYVKNNPLYKDFFEGIFDYQTDLSFKAGNVNKSSGKAQSYRNHLMKIIVFYKEVYGSYPTSLESEKTAAGIEAFFKMNDFVKLNREKKNFYSATINGYLDYLDQLKIVNAGESKESPSERYKIKLLKKPTRKKPCKRQFSSIHAILMKCLQPSIEAVGNVVMTAVMKHSSLKMIIKTLLRVII